MDKILGLDLGTNSIGWALRNPNNIAENQIEKFGVLTFKKGVGLGKTGEYSYAPERTKKRSTRKLYQARKYRLWATLEHLINEGFCPLTIEDLDKWRKYDKGEARENNNAGRVYPVWNTEFDAWIKLDFDGDGKPDYTSPYQLRKELAETSLDFTKQKGKFKLGRALYHIAQRRGFKSSRKAADADAPKETDNEESFDLQKSEQKKNKNIKELFEKYPEAKTIGWLFALLESPTRKENSIRAIAKHIIEKTNDEALKELIIKFDQSPSKGNKYRNKIREVINDKYHNLEKEYYKNNPINTATIAERIRENIAQYAIRENYKEEIKYIFQIQGFSQEHKLFKKLVESGKNKNDGSIFYKRPLRSQKGLIGKCTLEPNKYRAPISHPKFETFRAWCFLNNIKYKQENGHFEKLPLELKREIYHSLFFRKSKSYFPFSEIINFVAKKGYKWQFNYKPKITVTACPVSARLKEIFGEDYLNVKIQKSKAPKSEKNYYDIEDIWHVLFSYEDQEFVAEFAEQKLKLNPEKVKQFVIAWNALLVGYGMLSINAIDKINRFLEKGLIYTEAVLLANIPEIIGEKPWKENEQLFLDNISIIISENREQKSILNIVNNLVAKYKNLDSKFGYKDTTYQLKDSDNKDIESAIKESIGEIKWEQKPREEKEKTTQTVSNLYQAFFKGSELKRKDINGERHFEVISGNNTYYKTDTGFYRLPKLIDTLSDFLSAKFDLSEKQLKKIYHPSEINIYPPAKEDEDGLLKLGSPKTGSFKNPMAMRTLHELRKLINYLIETKQIDSDTRIVVEVARDLNDANKRWATEARQRQREAENQEFAKAIEELLKENSTIKANASSDDDIDKVRLFYEQNMKQTLPPVIEDEEDESGKKKKRKEEKDEVIRWKGYGSKLIDKYRLWKEQGYQCIYTGKFIKLTDLFNENVIDFEHTLPRSISFDNSLANLTVCHADYNRNIKRKRIPTQLENYDKDFGSYTAILPRLEAWKDKVERIKQQIDFWKTKSKKAADKTWKDDAIRQRHLWQMELDYWQNKLDRFTIKIGEITTGFKNSQKVDTQLISKYAFHYLKTYFEKVDTQKGSITAEFRKIYSLQPADEKKDRSKHSHHAKDAAVLTLIPLAAKRDEILQTYYEYQERKEKYTTDPYKGFKREFVWGIDDSILINNIAKDQSLTPANRKIRKRGKEVIIDGKNRWATGDCIRGQLHLDTFYGAIKPAKRGEKGDIEKDENGKMIQEDNVKFVLRVPFNADFTGVDKIVDEGLKKQIQEHIKRAGNFKKAFEEGIYLLDKNGKPHGNKVRHIRVWASVSEPLKIKKQTNLSDEEYKQHYYASNGENILCALYQKTVVDKRTGKQKQDRLLEIISLKDIADYLKTGEVSKAEDFKNILFRKDKKGELIFNDNGQKESPYAILKTDMKVIFFDNDIDELRIQENESQAEYRKRISFRTYKIVKFTGGRFTFLYHLEARNDNALKEAYPENQVFKVDEKQKHVTYVWRQRNKRLYRKSQRCVQMQWS